MSDHAEEQEMESEALAAIFDNAFEIISNKPPFEWSVKLVPIDCGGNEEEENKVNHVGVKLVAKIPDLYPDEKPHLDIEIIKGLAEMQRTELLKIAEEEAEANLGMAAMFAICERVREWLGENNVKGQDDGSMYAQMMRRNMEAERSKEKAQRIYEAQAEQEEITQAEKEELEVRKRRAEGTPCTKENFEAWALEFEKEMEAIASEEKKKALDKEISSTRKGKAANLNSNETLKNEKEWEGRLTGFEHFSGKAGGLSMEDIEAVVDEIEKNQAEEKYDDEELNVVDEDLFDDDDDLDDLSFEDDDMSD